MTLQLSKFKAYGLRCEGENRQRVQQVVEMYITGAATDTAWDISSDTAGALGTFWTAVVADGTYGTLATAALAVIRKIAGVALSLKGIEAEAFLNRTKLSAAGLLSFLSSASAGGAAAEAYTVTGLLATDTVVAVTPKVAAATRPEVKTFLSNSAAGGSASEVYVVTGLLATDTVIAVTPTVDTANAVYMDSWSTLAANALTVHYSGDPGAAGKVQVTVLRSSGAGFVSDPYTPVSYGAAGAGTLTVTYGGDPGAGAKVEVLAYRPAAASSVPGVGQYGVIVSGHLPSLTFGTSDAPTSMHLRMNWTLPDGTEAYVSDLGRAF